MPETCIPCGADDIPDGTLAEHLKIHEPIVTEPPEEDTPAEE